MNRSAFESWLKALGKAWIDRDPKAAAAICAESVLYYETPFDPPLRSRNEVEKIWQEVPASQKDIEFSYEILSVDEVLGIARWNASFTRVPSEKRDTLDGIFTVKLDNLGLCKEFHQWWVVKP
ncbi:nuclear transport factor 2 family protein [Candidatus Roizmanbacteria bacterium]|nr:nuclear transport factor 2 family protein [Candidatus Roizmanbacteria bacterium]